MEEKGKEIMEKKEKKAKKRVFSDEDMKLIKKYSLSDEQRKLLKRLRSLPSLKKLHTERMIMVVCAKKKFEKSKDTCMKFMHLVENFKIDEMTIEDVATDEHMQPFFDAGAFFYTTDRTKEGCGVMYGFMGNWVPPKTEESRRSTLACSVKMWEDFLLQHPQNVTEGFICIADISEFGWKNFDLKFSKYKSQLSTSFPARFKKIYIVDPPWYFRVVLAIVRPFVPAKFLDRMEVLKSEELKDHVEEKLLLPCWGGKMKFDYEQWLLDKFGVEKKKKKNDEKQEKKEEEQSKEEEIEVEEET